MYKRGFAYISLCVRQGLCILIPRRGCALSHVGKRSSSLKEGVMSGE